MNYKCLTCSNAIYSNSKEPTYCFLDNYYLGALDNPCSFRERTDLERDTFVDRLLDKSNEMLLKEDEI